MSPDTSSHGRRQKGRGKDVEMLRLEKAESRYAISNGKGQGRKLAAGHWDPGGRASQIATVTAECSSLNRTGSGNKKQQKYSLPWDFLQMLPQYYEFFLGGGRSNTESGQCVSSLLCTSVTVHIINSIG